MRVCCCSLAGTDACKTCLNGSVSTFTNYWNWWQDWYVPEGTGYVKNSYKKVTEKYDKDGKLIERIVEEPVEENYEWVKTWDDTGHLVWTKKYPATSTQFQIEDKTEKKDED